VSHHQGGAVRRFDHLCRSVGLARSGDAQQDLVLLAIEDAAGQSVNRPSLVALGLVGAYQLEVHRLIIGELMEWVRNAPMCKYALG